MNGLFRLRTLLGAGWGMRVREPESAGAAPDGVGQDAAIPGDRSVSATYRATSLQTRLTNFVALGLGALVMTTFLVWYYKHALAERPGEGEDRSTHDRGSESAAALPPLGRIDPPLIERVLGPAPALPEETSFSELEDRRWPEARDEEPSYDGARSDRQAPDRRLSGEAFVPAAARRGSGAHLPPRTATMTAPFDGAVSTSFSSSAPESGRGELADLLEPTVLEPAQAQVLPTRRLLLPKGAFLDCTLETAISSALPGMTTCVTATDTFSADGSVVLLERGSKLIGETRGQVRAGSNRVFVLWTEARTPTGVVVPLASPGTDALGRSGLPGEVDRHFWDRFGAAILISVIDGAVQAAVQRESNGDAVIINPAGSNDIMTEVLKSTIHIPPTVTKRHGDRIAVLVARDLDFRSVYELRTAGD